MHISFHLSVHIGRPALQPHYQCHASSLHLIPTCITQPTCLRASMLKFGVVVGTVLVSWPSKIRQINLWN